MFTRRYEEPLRRLFVYYATQEWVRTADQRKSWDEVVRDGLRLKFVEYVLAACSPPIASAASKGPAVAIKFDPLSSSHSPNTPRCNLLPLWRQLHAFLLRFRTVPERAEQRREWLSGGADGLSRRLTGLASRTRLLQRSLQALGAHVTASMHSLRRGAVRLHGGVMDPNNPSRTHARPRVRLGI